MPGVTQGPCQTHLVVMGRLKLSAYQDGDHLRLCEDGRIVATRRKDGTWPSAVRPAKPRPGRFDHIKPAGPAVQVILEKGEYY